LKLWRTLASRTVSYLPVSPREDESKGSVTGEESTLERAKPRRAASLGYLKQAVKTTLLRRAKP
jgi:hypothetical protein